MTPDDYDDDPLYNPNAEQEPPDDSPWWISVPLESM